MRKEDFIFGSAKAELEQIERNKLKVYPKKVKKQIIDWRGIGMLYFGTNVMSALMCFFVNDTAPNIFGMMNILITGLVGTCVAGLYLQALLEKIR